MQASSLYAGGLRLEVLPWVRKRFFNTMPGQGPGLGYSTITGRYLYLITSSPGPPRRSPRSRVGPHSSSAPPSFTMSQREQVDTVLSRWRTEGSGTGERSAHSSYVHHFDERTSRLLVFDIPMSFFPSFAFRTFAYPSQISLISPCILALLVLVLRVDSSILSTSTISYLVYFDDAPPPTYPLSSLSISRPR